MMQASKRLQHSIQLQVLISSLNTKVSNYLIAKTVISSNDSCFVTRLSDVGHASSQDCPMWDILRHRNVRCGTCTVARLSDVGHASTQDCSMRDMFRLRTVRCGPCFARGLSDVGHVPSQDYPVWDMFRNGRLPPMDTSVSVSDSGFACCTLTSCVSQQNRNYKQIPNKGRLFQRT